MQYDRSKVADALEMVRTGSSVRQAARLYGIPNSTLREKLLGRHSQPNPGKARVLEATEEGRIVEWLLAKIKVGFPVDTKRLVSTVAHYVRKSARPNPFKNGIPGRKWVNGFFSRHPEIPRRVLSVLPKPRTAVSEPQIRSWFHKIREHFEEEALSHVLKSPEKIFNLDGTVVRTIPTQEANSGQKLIHAKVGNAERESYTALFCGNATGQLAPTLMIYPYKFRMPKEIWQKLPKGWAAAKAESDIYCLFFKDVFYPWVVQQKITFPVIVFLDGYKSHVSFETMQLCTEKNIILVCLPPNSTEITQPLNVSFIRPLENFWNQVLVEWRTDNNGEILPRKEIASLLKQAVDRMTNLQSTLVNCFRQCGLYPLDPDAVNYSGLIGETSEAFSTQTVLPTMKSAIMNPL
ncbi:uncharacterized protein LOC129774767 isoform X2 [Toxorhynchites rutilus septentrionalis]|nr:uncharacterized protein LOC129774767 isoform X2 [Toxorhynchites rutilus septentrionalis]